jgi:two-component system, OmpR family, sensor kinase
MPASGVVTGVLRTVSLRRRVTWTALAVMSVVLIGVVVVVHALFGVVVNRGVNAVLADRVQLAEQLARQNVGPTVLIERVDARSVRGRLVLPDGQTYGSLSQRVWPIPGSSGGRCGCTVQGASTARY